MLQGQLVAKRIVSTFCILTHSLQWHHNRRDGVSNRLLHRLFGRRSKKTSKLRATGRCAGNSPGTGEFPAQMASNADNAFFWWRHYVRPRQHGHHFADIFISIFLNEKCYSNLIVCVPENLNNSKVALGRRWPGADYLKQWRSRLLTHICVTWPRWVKLMPLSIHLRVVDT